MVAGVPSSPYNCLRSGFQKTQMKNSKILFFFITLVAGIIILYPLLDFQYYVASGDHGRDLYAFQRTLTGAVPYRDYFWPFGPLMPYYYSLFYRLFGISIQSVLLGQMLLVLTTGCLLFLICSVFLPPLAGLVCAFWYWAYRGMEFFYTYNHSGGILAMLLGLWFLFLYIKESRRRYVYGGVLSCFFLSLIRLNIGISSLAAFFLSVALTDLCKKNRPVLKNLRFYLTLGTAAILLIIAIYAYVLHPLPNYAIAQCFPYFKEYRTDYSTSIGQAGGLLFQQLVSSAKISWATRATSCGFIFGIIYLGFLLTRGKRPRQERGQLLLALLSLFLFIVFNLHEFLGSGVRYRLLWVFPLVILIIVYVFFSVLKLGHAKIFTPLVQTLLIVTMLAAPYFHIRDQHLFISFLKLIDNKFQIGNNHIFVSQQPEWLLTVRATAAYLDSHLAKDEKFLALPFDPLFYYLTDRPSPTRQLIFFYHNHITREQEQEIIQGLEQQKVNTVIISNRAYLSDEGLGIFGKDCCRLMAQYIAAHFETVAEFGDWVNPAGWAWSYGVKILKRVR
jgi:hypothetical protein